MKRAHQILISITTFVLLLSTQSRMWAGDPFRVQNPHKIDNKTQTAFEELFHKGNYTAAKATLSQAVKNGESDPLAYAMSASLSYIDGDYENVNLYAQKTLETAQKLKSLDILRSNLYLGVGYFLQGSYILKTEGPVAAIAKLQQVFQYLEAAEDLSPNDPELNLIKGYLELLLAVNLPFSSPQKAIENFQKYAAPSYLVDRGVAMAYRDLKQYDKSLEFLDKAIAQSPGNPELFYLKGQVLRIRGLQDSNQVYLQESLSYFDKANQKRDQLPKTLLIPLDHDRQAATDEVKQLKDKKS